MREFKATGIFAGFLAITVLTFGADVLAQGKGRGHGQRGQVDRGTHLGGGQRGRGREPQSEAPQQQAVQHGRGTNRGRRMQQEVQQVQEQRQNPQRQPQRAQVSAQQNRGNNRRAQMQQRMQQIQRQQAPGLPQQNRGIDRRVRMQQQIQQPHVARGWSSPGNGRPGWNREGRIRAQPQIIPQPKARGWSLQTMRGNRVKGRRGGRGTSVRDGSYIPRRSTMLTRVWPNNYGQQRRAAVHQRKAERRELGDLYRNRQYRTLNFFWQQRAYTPRYRARTFFDNYLYGSRAKQRYSYPSRYSSDNSYTYSNAYYPGQYDEPNYDYSAYDPSAGDIFRNLIFAVLGGGRIDYRQGSYSEPYYNAESYSGSDGYQRRGYYPARYSNEVDPGYYDPNFYDDPYYADVLPIQYFDRDRPGSGLFRQMFTQLLAIGYEQGYQQGIAARRVKELDRVFYDPYSYDNASYDPYSVSLGDNRRCLSEGYGLGYQDAINEMDGYDQFQGGGVDLVSVLIGTVSNLM